MKTLALLLVLSLGAQVPDTTTSTDTLTPIESRCLQVIKLYDSDRRVCWQNLEKCQQLPPQPTPVEPTPVFPYIVGGSAVGALVGVIVGFLLSK